MIFCCILFWWLIWFIFIIIIIFIIVSLRIWGIWRIWLLLINVFLSITLFFLIYVMIFILRGFLPPWVDYSNGPPCHVLMVSWVFFLRLLISKRYEPSIVNMLLVKLEWRVILETIFENCALSRLVERNFLLFLIWGIINDFLNLLCLAPSVWCILSAYVIINLNP